MNQGWIKLHRRILENPVTSKPDWAWLWIVILLLANHSDNEVIWNGEKRTIKRGSFITSRAKLSLHSGIHESSIERALKYFKSEQQIEQQANKKFRLITVLKYADYQEGEQVVEHQVNNKRTSNEQQLNTNKNDKKEKNEKKKNIYGEFKNVLLEEKEYDSLIEKFGEVATVEKIENLSSYIASKGKSYKSHYATILVWDKKNPVKKTEARASCYDTTKIEL